jgi:hypothetical protein
MHDLDRQQLEQYERTGPFGEPETGELGTQLSEAQEMALAAEVLEISSEEELGQFLKGLWDRTASTTGAAWRSDAVQKDLLPAVRKVAKVALPIVTKAITDRYAPGWGTTAGAAMALTAGQLLEAELEGLSGEDREFEIARSFVRFTDDAMQRAARAPAHVPSPAVAEVAISQSVGEHLPGLVPFLPQLLSDEPDSGEPNGASGRWVRQGSSIVIDLG